MPLVTLWALYQPEAEIILSKGAFPKQMLPPTTHEVKLENRFNSISSVNQTKTK